MRLQRQTDGKMLTLDTAAPLGKGGEAGVYKVVGDPTLAAKVYAPGKDLTERLAKLEVMLRNPPDIPDHSPGHAPVAWPLDLLRDPEWEYRIVGFLMPRVHDASQVIDYYNPQTRLEKSPLFDYRYLLRTARNLAATVRALHARDIILGDLKHSNVLVTETALVTLVDTDSFQVHDPKTGRLFPCPVHTPDFTPPELQESRDIGKPLCPEQDNFGLTVMLFQLLMEGTHPFAGIYDGDEDPPPFEERIAKGHFPYGTLPVPCRPGTRIAPSFTLLPPPLQDLFVRCFEGGYSDPLQRPDAKTWQAALDEATRSLARCDANPHHFYSNHLDACPWCERKRAQLHGLDPFPSEQAVREHKHLPKPPASRPESTQRPLAVSTPPANLYVPAAHAAPQTPLISRFIVGLLSLVFGVFGLLGVLAVGSVMFGSCASNSMSYDMEADESGAHALENRKVEAVAWSPDGKHFYGGNKTLYAWDAATGNIEQAFLGHSDLVRGLALSHDGKLLAAYSGDIVHIWSTDEGNSLHTFYFPSPINAMTLSPNGKTLVVGTEDHLLSLWDIATEKQICQLACGSYVLKAACYSPNGEMLAICGNLPGESIVKVWNTHDYKPLNVWRDRKHTDALAFSPNNQTLACGGDGIRLVYPQGDTNTITPFSEEDCDSLSFSPNGTELALTNTGGVELLNMQAREKVSGFELISSPEPHTIAFSPDGQVLLTGSNDHELKRYDAVTGAFFTSSPFPDTP